jgi:hypothetical protein
MIAKLALFLWPLVVLVLFLRVSRATAIAVAIIGGYLLLPQEPSIDLPVLPPVNKDTVPAIAALAMALLFARRHSAEPAMPGVLPADRVGRILVPLLFVATFLTVFANGDRLVYGDTVLPALRLFDGVSAARSTLVTVLPFLLARKYLASPDQQRTLVLVFAVAGLAYTLPALYEVRMSPQLSRMVYGYFPSSWGQSERDGGFRPLVFLHHGLWMAIFFTCAAIAAAAWVRLAAPGQPRLMAIGAFLWIFATLVLCKSLGSLGIAVLLVPLVLFLPRGAQLVAAAILAGTVLTYPVLRQFHLVPVQAVVDTIRGFEPQRAASLQYRINNEDILLDKATERFLTGYGGWGRFRVFDDEGNDISTTDGRWIIVMGQGGFLRYLGEFGLMAAPVILLAFRRRRLEPDIATTALALMMTANLIDMIPNGTSTPLSWFMAGALFGRLEYGAARAPSAVASATAAARPAAPVYSRQLGPVHKRQGSG